MNGAVGFARRASARGQWWSSCAGKKREGAFGDEWAASAPWHSVRRTWSKATLRAATLLRGRIRGALFGLEDSVEVVV